MRVLIMDVLIYLPWSHSLKEKRREKAKIIDRMKNRWNISIMETDYQDFHQSLFLAMACVCLDEGSALAKRDEIQKDLDEITDGILQKMSWEIR
ncbi:MAG: DUF503 domain-containing protein [Tissierellia bacterium]|nr:DUF503 domain-containing protein [Tissierellia bacterium]